ncbi:biopolymer transporter ExbD [Flavobacterium selenitireducens]|uniref:biopolymer transporter ExbD n=1 Tax=Flavobacterium selenitireducens TaxID=2722704 RepID=UPI00168B84A4|nr:biopolymer transporter ExbD [Flavobacterium selenitireducens]MBD3583970.1 hypothetical protein [Flavobacterium selenitireducens]
MSRTFLPYLCFFSFTLAVSCFQKPDAVTLSMPDATDEIAIKPEDEFRTMTILVGSDNNLKYYFGKFNPEKVSDTKTGQPLHEEIEKLKRTVADQSSQKGESDTQINVLIKVNKDGNYEVLTAILDEMTRSAIRHYAISHIRAEESEMFK